ncbi:MAG: hypothetical protein IKT32_05575, partial [Clostridia bacterium]|nr:hypothetical protein [Clostridia bacterium]
MWYFTNAEQIAEVFTPLHIISCISISIVNAVLLFLISYKFLQVMQQSGYEGFGYFKWLRR